MMNFILLILGFILLIFGAGRLIDSASFLARKLNVPDIVIGLTVVALGTSAPELVVNIMASSRGESGLVMGNVIGSNLFNILMILGVTSIIKPLTVKRNTTWLEIPLSLLAALLVLIISSDIFLDKAPVNIITRSEGVILLGLFLIFIVYNLELARKGNEEVAEISTKQQTVLISVLWMLAGLGGLVYGGHLIVEHATSIARQFGISERVIAITIISTGTSLPELATSFVAVKKGKVDMAIGNVVGSGIFNVFLILGASSVVRPIIVSKESLPDIVLNIAANLLLFLFLFFNTKRNLRRPEGIVLLLLYIAYIFYLLFPGKFGF
ncbi:MAG TPA: calcium/sodium antiporter [Chitinophagaceae bacterium]|nr:calcium/sodium antiporter [Chitinophagaceae bacterium]